MCQGCLHIRVLTALQILLFLSMNFVQDLLCLDVLLSSDLAPVLLLLFLSHLPLSFQALGSATSPPAPHLHPCSSLLLHHLLKVHIPLWLPQSQPLEPCCDSTSHSTKPITPPQPLKNSLQLGLLLHKAGIWHGPGPPQKDRQADTHPCMNQPHSPACCPPHQHPKQAASSRSARGHQGFVHIASAVPGTERPSQQQCW